MRVADLTVDEFQTLLKTTLRELVVEIVDEKLEPLIDPDAGLEMRDDFRQSLLDYLASDQPRDDVDDVVGWIGLARP
jgi:hypothetical protein